MKRALFIIAVIAGFGATSLTLHSQAPAPAVAPAPVVVIPAGPPLEMLKAIRDQNAKLLEAQATAIQKLEELEKASQAVKVLGRRS